MSASNHSEPVQVTFFPDFAAATKREVSICLHELADQIITTNASSKGKLPWLKLGTFGDLRSEGRSLRNNDNVQTITGIEADYDAEVVGFDEARDTLLNAGVEALLYTSPSHTEAAPRWRVLCRFSESKPPEQRDFYMARLNGLFGGILARESWTLSQSFYFGAVNHNPDHRAETIVGTPIDLMPELDAGAIGKPKAKAGNGVANERPAGWARQSYVVASDLRLEAYRLAVLDALRRQATDGQKHVQLRSAALALGGVQAASGFADDQAVQWLMDALPSTVADWNAAQKTARWGLEQGRQKPIQLQDRPHPGNGTHAPHAPSSHDTDRQAFEETHGAATPEPEAEAMPPPGDADGETLPGLRDHLAIEAWAARPIPPADRLLGDVLTTTSRMFLVGRTGLGKTMLGFGMACGIAAGHGFLHWQSVRAARVLYIDGEMPGELIKTRSIDALRRSDIPPPPGNLVIYSRDTEDEFAALFPTLGKMPPLNTEQGLNFLLALIHALGGIDVVIFDNVMSLIAGDQKDEIPWSDTLPLVAALTAKRIGQVWLDHTGHNTDRQYGSSTKAWRFDAVGVMTPLPDDQRDRHDTAFTLSFDHPGKARRRTPDNWRDFDTCTIRLRDDCWTSETASPPDQSRVTPMGRQFHGALLDALVISATSGQATRDLWFSECARLGLVTSIVHEDNHAQREAKRRGFRKYIAELKAAGWIGVDGETVRSLRRDPP